LANTTGKRFIKNSGKPICASKEKSFPESSGTCFTNALNEKAPL
jgi:hypothetical protein